jgi:hypothetical protein
MREGTRGIGRRWMVALLACSLPVWTAACGGASDAGRIEASLGGAIYGQTRVDCSSREGEGRWLCAVEDDPGSGWSRRLYVRVADSGCWRATVSSHRYTIRRCLT